MNKKIVSNPDARDLEFYFFELIEKSYNELLDMYNDYKALYEQFGDIEYGTALRIFMGAIRTKRSKEVNVT